MHRRSSKRARAFLCLWLAATAAGAAWRPGTQFKTGDAAGRPGLIDPDGRPFKSVGMVWAYGPERGPLSGELTAERVTNQLRVIKELGFNTLNLYGDRFVPEMLTWCDENELAVYFRTSYYSLPDFPGELKEYPDYMDPKFRAMAKASYTNFLRQIQGHPSVLALDMDHRWLFPLDWGGGTRMDTPKLRPQAVAFFPRWLETRYGSVAKLNAAWGTAYAAFDDVIRDDRLVKSGEFQKLREHPARVDVYRYTLWTAADFLKDLAGFLRAEVPGLIVTPTTEHPECIPETNPDPSTGIAFMSPVHYNGLDDFQRDLPGLCKLIYETRWHYDMQGGPVYISETGFRTATLEQKPPTKIYAWITSTNEESAARAYAEEFGLLNALPWIGGYGYFMLYDKWAEGDFGYLRDDGTKKPMAYVGDALNAAVPPRLADPEPAVWIYYPDYAQATHRPGFQQLKTWVAVWEKTFLDALRENVDRSWSGLRAGDRKAGIRFGREVEKSFRRYWRGFAFCKSLPEDDRPVLLLSTISEILSRKDREALKAKKTISFGNVGMADEFMRPTDPWNLEAMGLKTARVAEKYVWVKLPGGAGKPLAAAAEGPELWSGTNSPWAAVPEEKLTNELPCARQVIRIPGGYYTRMELLAGSTAGNAAPSCWAEYSSGLRQQGVMGPTISDVRYPPVLTGGVQAGGRWLSRIVVPLEPGQELLRIELPDAPYVGLFGMVLVGGGVARDVAVSLPVEDGAVTNVTPWWLPVPVDTGLDVLKQFAGGEPAVVASGRHVSFLFDPLTWSGRTNEVSARTDVIREWVDAAMAYLKKAKE